MSQFNPSVSVFDPFKKGVDQTPRENVPIRQVFDRIRSDAAVKAHTEFVRRGADADEQDRRKKRSESFTAQGAFALGKSIKGTMPSPSGVYFHDIDFDKNSEALASAMQLEDVAGKLATHPNVFAVCRSIRGNGLRVFMRGPEAVGDKYKQTHDAMRAELHFVFGLVVDELKDLQRICYLGHDANLRINENAVPFVVIKSDPSPELAVESDEPSDPDGVKPGFEFVRLTTGATVDQLRAVLASLDPAMKRNPWISVIAGAKHEFGDSEEVAALLEEWSSKHPDPSKYEQGEALKIYRSAVRQPLNREPSTFGNLLRMAEDSHGTLPAELERLRSLTSDEPDDVAASPAVEDKKVVAFLNARRFDSTNPPPREPWVFKLAGVEVAHPGNLLTLSAMMKAGKSNFFGGALASILGPGHTYNPGDIVGDYLGWQSDGNPNSKHVLHFDTEQSRHDHYSTVRRALTRAGVADGGEPSWFRSWCLTGESASFLLRCVEVAMRQFTKRGPGVHSVFIDGIADLVTSPNEDKECFQLLAQIRNLAIEAQCPVLCSLHLNPDGVKTRGHLGSELDRKSESVLEMKKEMKEGEKIITVLMADKSRHAPIPDGTAPRFVWSPIYDMHVTLPPSETGNTPSKVGRRKIEIDVCAIIGDDALRESEVIARGEERHKVSESTVKSRLSEAVASGLVTQGPDKLYRCNGLL